MNIRYSREVDALSIDLSQGKGKITTVEVKPGVHVDFDEDGRCVSIELLDASFHVAKTELDAIATPSDPMTLSEAEQAFGLSEATWRQLINRGRVAGMKVGTTWTLERADAMNYLESRSPRGRPPAKRKARRPKVRALTERRPRPAPVRRKFVLLVHAMQNGKHWYADVAIDEYSIDGAKVELAKTFLAWAGDLQPDTPYEILSFHEESPEPAS